MAPQVAGRDVHGGRDRVHCRRLAHVFHVPGQSRFHPLVGHIIKAEDLLDRQILQGDQREIDQRPVEDQVAQFIRAQDVWLHFPDQPADRVDVLDVEPLLQVVALADVGLQRVRNESIVEKDPLPAVTRPGPPVAQPRGHHPQGGFVHDRAFTQAEDRGTFAVDDRVEFPVEALGGGGGDKVRGSWPGPGVA